MCPSEARLIRRSLAQRADSVGPESSLGEHTKLDRYILLMGRNSAVSLGSMPALNAVQEPQDLPFGSARGGLFYS